jgi:hypothetical protein
VSDGELTEEFVPLPDRMEFPVARQRAEELVAEGGDWRHRAEEVWSLQAAVDAATAKPRPSIFADLGYASPQAQIDELGDHVRALRSQIAELSEREKVDPPADVMPPDEPERGFLTPQQAVGISIANGVVLLANIALLIH